MRWPLIVIRAWQLMTPRQSPRLIVLRCCERSHGTTRLPFEVMLALGQKPCAWGRDGSPQLAQAIGALPQGVWVLLSSSRARCPLDLLETVSDRASYSPKMVASGPGLPRSKSVHWCRAGSPPHRIGWTHVWAGAIR